MSPALGEEVNKDAGHACVCGAQGSQGLDKTQSQPAYITQLVTVGCLRPRKITKSTAYISLCHLAAGFKKKFKKQSFSEIKLDQGKELLVGWATVHSLTKLFSSDQLYGEPTPSHPAKLKADPRKGLKESPWGARIAHVLLSSPQQSVHITDTKG